MKIAFLCSSLAPGQDGVGDYTRRLAAECIRQGHPSVILGLNDLQVHEAAPESQKMEGSSISVLRLPRVMDLDSRAMMARKWLDDFHPDWMSLQYVCYGYHPKGLSWQWNRIFAELGNRCPHRHLMFHELWIGEAKHSPLRQRLIGMAQRWIVCAMHRRFQPNVVTTSMGMYQRRLARSGIAANILPLFGNIPIAFRDDDYIAGLLRAAGSRTAQKPRNTFLNGVFFGTVHPDFRPEPLVRWLMELQSQAAKTVLLNIIGQSGKAAARLAEQVVSVMPDTLEVVILGEQPEQTISQALQFADFGINTGSPETLGKSGTFAAMREHGLPVVLADGELDSTILQHGASSVLQFSTNNSATVIRRSSEVATGTGVIRTVADLICFYAKAALNQS
jgi:glycosyltransferase involved in cell wall biosynthesis